MTTRREFVRTAAIGACATVLTRRLRASDGPPRRNLLLITADDLNWSFQSYLGGHPGLTPGLDAFARTAHCFARLHAAAPICQPSRSALMTGRVPHRNGALGFNPVWPDVPTLPEVLKAAGYFTAGVNKLPHMAPPGKFPWDYRSNAGGEDAPEPIPVEVSPRNPATYARHFKNAVEAARAAGRPFFINLNIVDPHRPFFGTARDQARGGAPGPAFAAGEIAVPDFLEDLPDVRREIAQYASSVHRMDRSVGNIMAALRESGLEDRTCVLFVSDHGMPLPFGKTTLYENGTRTPLLLRLPGETTPQRNDTAFACNTDIMPTVLELLAVPAPPGLDGKSLVPLLNGGSDPARDHVFTSVNGLSSGASFPGRAMRSASFSYIYNAWPDGKRRFNNESMQGLTFPAMVAAGRTDPAIQQRVDFLVHRCPEEYYDLTTDPAERHNRVNDPACAAAVTAARRAVLAEMVRTSDPLRESFAALIQGGRRR